MALTELEKEVLRLSAGGLSDYRIARKLKMDTTNVTRSRRNGLRKIECAKADLSFARQVGVEK